MKKYILFGVVSATFFSLFSLNARAEKEEFLISIENQNLIMEAENREVSNVDYISNIIDMYYESESDYYSESDFNRFLNESLTQLKIYDDSQDQLLILEQEKALSEIKSTEVNSLALRSNTQRIPEPANPIYATAIGAYKTGIQLVKNKGHWQTANYMTHAIKPQAEATYGLPYTPKTYYNKNDTWAKMVDGNELATAYYNRLKSEAFSGGRQSGSFSGSYQFKSGHLHTALRGVSYTVSYKKQKNGNYWTQVKVTDIFDFKWEPNGYDNNFGVGFGNNYAYAMQEMGYIVPYKIEIINEISR